MKARIEGRPLRLLVVGMGRHGKDTFCELTGLPFASSSYFIAEKVVLPALGPIYGYKDVEECYADRGNHRAEWHRLISDYNKDDRAKLAKEILAENNIYCGMRCDMEVAECMRQGLFDLIIWVDASERLPAEPVDSNKLTKDHADVVIYNNGTLAEFEEKVKRLMTLINK